MPAQPQDHKTAGEFTWTSPDGVEITLPSMSTLKGGVIRRYRKLPEVDFMYSVLEAIVDPAELEKVDELSMPDTNALFTAWQANEGATFPE